MAAPDAFVIFMSFITALMIVLTILALPDDPCSEVVTHCEMEIEP